MIMTVIGRDADALLREAALFTDQDQGEAGFLERFARAVQAAPGAAAQALAGALDARARAGAARVALVPGDLRIAMTSAGGSLVVCALTEPRGGAAVSLRLADEAHAPVAGACVRVRDVGRAFAVVTDACGTAAFQGAGGELVIELGGRAPAAERDSQAGGSLARPGWGAPGRGRLIALPRAPQPDQLELAAASRGAPAAAAGGLHSVEAGGVTFWGRERRSGYDLTLLVAGVSAGTGDSAVGAFGVTFVTTGLGEARDRWVVPLSPSPQGLAGSLHSTDAQELDADSVEVRGAGHLLASLGDELGEVVRRSVRHADAETAWVGLSRRLRQGPARAAVEAALEELQAPR